LYERTSLWKAYSKKSNNGHTIFFSNAAAELRSAMSVNKNLRVFAAMGYYDLTTPYLSQRYSFEHLAADSAFMGRIRMRSYSSGHQIYTFTPALKQLTADVGEFVRGEN
jgi:carboxypeptidase C (cathepsin A)